MFPGGHFVVHLGVHLTVSGVVQSVDHLSHDIGQYILYLSSGHFRKEAAGLVSDVRQHISIALGVGVLDLKQVVY